MLSDDILIFAPKCQGGYDLKADLIRKYHVNDIGPAEYFIGLEIKDDRDKKAIYVH